MLAAPLYLVEKALYKYIITVIIIIIIIIIIIVIIIIGII